MRLLLAAAIVLGLAAAPASAQPADVPVASFSNGTHAFHHRLLSEALEAGGSPASLRPSEDLPQPRIAHMLGSGDIAVHWFVQSAERDRDLVPVGLTDGLIGKRVLFVRPGDEARFADVRSVDDLRATGAVGGFGAGWFDVQVWRANALPHLEQQGEWRLLYRMLAAGDRGVGYFSRGVTEILGEAQQNPALAVEPRLLLVYDRDFRFYVSPARRELAEPLSRGLAALRESGRHAALIEEHFGETLRALGVAGRTAIRLAMPQ